MEIIKIMENYMLWLNQLISGLISNYGVMKLNLKWIKAHTILFFIKGIILIDEIINNIGERTQKNEV